MKTLEELKDDYQFLALAMIRNIGLAQDEEREFLPVVKKDEEFGWMYIETEDGLRHSFDKDLPYEYWKEAGLDRLPVPDLGCTIGVVWTNEPKEFKDAITTLLQTSANAAKKGGYKKVVECVHESKIMSTKARAYFYGESMQDFDSNIKIVLSFSKESDKMLSKVNHPNCVSFSIENPLDIGTFDNERLPGIKYAIGNEFSYNRYKMMYNEPIEKLLFPLDMYHRINPAVSQEVLVVCDDKVKLTRLLEAISPTGFSVNICSELSQEDIEDVAREVALYSFEVVAYHQLTDSFVSTHRIVMSTNELFDSKNENTLTEKNTNFSDLLETLEKLIIMAGDVHTPSVYDSYDELNTIVEPWKEFV